MTPLAPNARLRFDAIQQILADIDTAESFLEIGCGQGAAATVLARHFDYVGYEPDTTSFEIARRRLAEVGAGYVVNELLSATPYRLFDVVGAFEVLEHIEDDRSALAEWLRWLRPGGSALVSVPAHPERFGPGDYKAGHFRRYTGQSITELMASAGLVEIRVIAYGFPLGYALEWVRNRLASGHEKESVRIEERTAASGRWLQPTSSVAPLVWAGTLPFVWLQRHFAHGDLGTGLVACGSLPT